MIPALRGVTVDTGFVSHLGEGLGIRKNILNLPGCSRQRTVNSHLSRCGQEYLLKPAAHRFHYSRIPPAAG